MTTNILVGLGAWLAAGALVAPLVGRFIRGPLPPSASDRTGSERDRAAGPTPAAAQRRSAGAT